MNIHIYFLSIPIKNANPSQNSNPESPISGMSFLNFL